MAKGKSQWDFGELFPAEATRRVLTVGELTAQVRRLLETQVGQVWVTGEVTNLRVQSSGHRYFTLKDADAQLNCVLFRNEPVSHRELLEDGRKLVVQGDLTVYEPRGQYQLIVHQLELHGVGELQLAFEKLKQKLQGEGLFAPERKRTLPKYPQRIGLVTSLTGAAIRDVLHGVRRRNPGLEIILAPCRVQGEGAAAEIAAAIRLLNAFAVRNAKRLAPFLDLILLTRGGGSLEDLWAFNEETVARAIFDSALPVVSAVGHEIDFTISDFVADVRSATPSVAAEIITEGVFASRQWIADAPGWMAQRLRRRLEIEGREFRQLADRMTRVHPRRLLNERLQRLDDLQAALWRAAETRRREARSAWLLVRQRLAGLRPREVLKRRGQRIEELDRRLRDRAGQGVKSAQSRMDTVEARLKLLSPANVLERGYSITTDLATGAIIRAAGEVLAGQRLRTRLKQGEIRSIVEPES
jgi:exodeoxyribonuclease VII large subunit